MQRIYPPLMIELLRLLPPPGTPWSPQKREDWLAALEASCRVLYEIIPDPRAQKPKHEPFNIEPPY